MIGLDRFAAHFEGCEHQYVLIGGAACDVVMEEAGLDFRATRDLDIVLCVEALDAGFAERFKAFVLAGGYEVQERSDGKKAFYRFQKPKDPAYPSMLELFSREPEAIRLAEDAHLTPVPVDEDILSLSAILLDDAYYEALLAGRRVVKGVSLLDATLLIPFKARAFLDLSARKAEGEAVDAKSIRKHRNDVFRLLQLLAAGGGVQLSEPIKADLAQFIAAVAADVDFNPAQQNLGTASADELLARLRAAYGLGDPGPAPG